MLRFLFFACVTLSMASLVGGEKYAWASSEHAEDAHAEDAHAEKSEETNKEEDIYTTKPVKVKVDVQERDGFSRIVFLPDFVVNMEAEESDTSDYKGIIIGFSRTGYAELEPTRVQNLKNIYDVQIISRLDEGLDIKILFPKTSKYRFFTIQKRGILDVFAPEDKADLTPEKFTQIRKTFHDKLEELKMHAPTGEHGEEAEHEETSKETHIAKSEKKKEELPQAADVNLKKEVKAATHEILTHVDDMPVNAALGDTEITFSSTENFGMAIFERMGYLWAVTDQDDMRLPPVVDGDNVDLIGPAEKVEVDGATAYRFKLPKNAYIQPQGGGFIWKIKISGEPYALPSASIRKEYSKDGDSKLRLTLKNTRSLLRVKDPLIGDDFAVVTVPKASDRLFKSANFVDVDILPAYSGAVLVPKSDGIRIEAGRDNITVSKRNGLNIGPAVLTFNKQKASKNKGAPSSISGHKGSDMLAETEIEQGRESIFGFDKWVKQMDAPYYDELQKRRLEVSAKRAAQKRGLLMQMSEFLVANAMPYEAVGYLDMVEDDIKVAGISPNQVPEYTALRAVALIGERHYKEALRVLDTPSMKNLEEMNFWRALALAGEDKIDEAYDVLPEELNFLKSYPLEFRNRLLLELSELALKAGDANLLQSLANQLQLQEGSLNKAQKAGLDFYKGRVAMMNGLPGDVKVMLARAIKADDLYYSTRAELALIKEQIRNEEISAKDAIPRLERIRYAWRGDDIEAEINRMLGETYINNGEQQKGLNILRAASSMMRDKADREKLSNTMVKAFQDIYLDEDSAKDMKPLQAFGIYEEFSELLPSGHNGDKIIMTIVDKLASVELYSRALSLIDEHMDDNLSSAKKPLWTLKAAAFSLLDRKPAKTLEYLSSLPEARFTSTPETAKKYYMLKARALAELKRTDEAIAILDTMPPDDDVLRLSADTGWDAQRWGYAASALDAILRNTDVDDTQGVGAKVAQLILNTAIAHNLAGNKDRLAQIRAQYSTAMRSSPLFKSFQVVTRPVRDAVLSDKQTIMSHVFEADMFDKSLTDMSAFDANDTSDQPADTDG